MAGSVTLTGLLLLLASLTPADDWWHVDVPPWVCLTLVGIGVIGEIGERAFNRRRTDKAPKEQD